MSDIKRCTECKHYVPALEQVRVSRCGRTNLIGEPNEGSSPAYERRCGVIGAWLEGICGRSARFWEPKP